MAASIACSNEQAAGPVEENTNSPRGVVISNAHATAALAKGIAIGTSASSSTGIAYISTEPQTFPEGISAVLRNVTTGGKPVVAAILNGGFDPIPLDADDGDEISITVTNANGATLAPILTKVPPRRPPRVVRSNPSSGRVDVALDVQILIVFSEPIDRATVDAQVSLLQNGNRVSGTLRVSDDRLTVEFVPQDSLHSLTSYELRVDRGIRDLDGEPLEEASTSTFKTGDAGITPTGETPLSAKTIVFTRLGDRQVWRVNGDGTGAVILTHETGRGCYRPSWSPDGKKIAFAMNTPDGSNNGFGTTDIFVMDADGSGMAQRTFNGNLWSVQWSPDGQKLAVSTEGVYYSDIYIVSAEGPSQPLHIASDAKTPAWSPDGKTIAYVHTSGDDGYHQVMLMNADGSNLHELTPVDPGGIYGLGWSPKGDKLAFSKCNAGDCGIYVMNPDGSDVQRIANHAGNGLAWSSDGKWIAFTLDEYPGGIWTPKIAYIPAEGGPPVVIMTEAFYTSWKP